MHRSATINHVKVERPLLFLILFLLRLPFHPLRGKSSPGTGSYSFLTQPKFPLLSSTHGITRRCEELACGTTRSVKFVFMRNNCSRLIELLRLALFLHPSFYSENAAFSRLFIQTRFCSSLPLNTRPQRWHYFVAQPVWLARFFGGFFIRLLIPQARWMRRTKMEEEKMLASC